MTQAADWRSGQRWSATSMLCLVHPFASSRHFPSRGNESVTRLAFCTIWHHKHSGNWLTAFTSPIQGQNKPLYASLSLIQPAIKKRRPLFPKAPFLTIHYFIPLFYQPTIPLSSSNFLILIHFLIHFRDKAVYVYDGGRCGGRSPGRGQGPGGGGFLSVLS